MFEQTFKNIDDILRKESGCTTELDYTEQTSWLLFLKYLDGLEQDKADEAALLEHKYNFILDQKYRWETWAAPKSANGKLDHNAALVGDDLRDFVNRKLFPYLHSFTQKATGPNTIEYKIGEIFGEINNKISSGYNLREIIDLIDELRFRSQTEKHELSHLYEAKIKNMGNAGRNGGEYYTPRPLIRAIVQVIHPRVGERIYDGAVGSAGFLCEAFDYLKRQPGLTTSDLKTLQENTFYGKEKKPLAYVIAIMNMILHGIEAPNIIHTNTLSENLADIQDKDRYDIVLANPPFGGNERKEVQQNFPIRTGETAFLFLQHFIKMLKAGGRGGVVIKNTFLSNTDNASVSLRKLLLESCNLHTVLDCPGGTFQGAGVKTVVLFFEKGAPTRKVWFYQLDPGRNMGKTNPLNDADLVEFVELQKTFADSPKSWSVEVAGVDKASFDLSVKNPNGGEAVVHRGLEEILDEIASLDAESAEVLAVLLRLDSGGGLTGGWMTKPIADFAVAVSTGPFGSILHKSDYVDEGVPLVNPINIVAESIIPDPKKLIGDSTKQRLGSYVLAQGDVVVARRGEIGRCAVVGADETGWVCGTGCFFIRPLPNLDPQFLAQLIRSSGYREKLEQLSTGTTMQNLSNSALGDLAISVPPLPEQQRIVALLDEAFAGIATAKADAEKKLAALDELKKALLHKAFSGEL